LRFVDCPDELLINIEFGAQGFFGTGPVPKAASVSFARRFESAQGRYPTASRIHLIGKTDQTDADRPETAVIGRTVRGKRPARVEIPTPVAELKLRLRQTFYLYRCRH
jgi:hypothetical protein